MVRSASSSAATSRRKATRTSRRSRLWITSSLMSLPLPYEYRLLAVVVAVLLLLQLLRRLLLLFRREALKVVVVAALGFG